MRTTIVRMSRFGRGYSVKLECGCLLRVTLEEAEREQLFIGKAVDCVECGEERA